MCNLKWFPIIIITLERAEKTSFFSDYFLLVRIPARWPTRPELIPVSVAWSYWEYFYSKLYSSRLLYLSKFSLVVHTISWGKTSEMSQAWSQVFLSKRHNSEHVDLVISGAGRPQENRVLKNSERNRVLSKSNFFSQKFITWNIGSDREIKLFFVAVPGLEESLFYSIISNSNDHTRTPMEDLSFATSQQITNAWRWLCSMHLMMMIQVDKWINMVNFVLVNKCKRWVNLHDTSMGQRKTLSPPQESNPWPPKYRAGALSTELRELMESQVILTEFIWSKFLSEFLWSLKWF